MTVILGTGKAAVPYLGTVLIVTGSRHTADIREREKLMMNSIIIKEGVAEFFNEEFMRYSPKVYKADIDEVTYNGVSKGEAFKNYLEKDYRNFNTGKNVLQYFVFYAVCALGCCDLLMIEMFLKSLPSNGDVADVLKNPNRDKIRSALQKFTQYGLLLRHHYVPEEGEYDSITLYLPTQTGLILLKNAMQKEGTKEVFTPVMPHFRLLGKAVSTYISLSIMEHLPEYERRLRDGFFSTFVGGHLFMNNMIEMDEGGYLIGNTDLFMDFHNINYLIGDADRFVDQKIMLMEQFKLYAKGLMKIPKTVVCLSDEGELEAFLRRVFKKKTPDALLSGVFFTTEAAFRNDLPKKFMTVYQNDDGTYEIATTEMF